jgi:hypothetical protein
LAKWNSEASLYGRYNFVKTGLGTFAMDNGKLLLKKNGEDYPCPLTGQETHALFNLLYDHLKDIIAANAEAHRYGTTNGHHTGPRKKKRANVYSE